MKQRSWGRAVMAAVAVLLVAAIIALPLVIYIGNDQHAAAVARQLEKTPLPERTEIIECVSEAGKLVGSGNGMQYFGALLLKSDLELEQLDAYYAQFRKNEWEYVVSEQSGSNIDAVEHGVSHFLELDNETKVSGYYILYSWGSSLNGLWDCDIRGH